MILGTFFKGSVVNSQSLKRTKLIIARTSILRVDQGNCTNMELLLVIWEEVPLASGISRFDVESGKRGNKSCCRNCYEINPTDP